MTLGVRARYRPALPLLAVLVGVLLDWLWLAGPRCAALAEGRARLAASRNELAAARREVATRTDTRQAVREAARALRRAAMRLPEARELGALLAAVADSARAARLELLLLRPKAERAAGDHVEVPVELHVRGTYLDALAFLRQLEEIGRLVRVGDLRIERPERAPERGNDRTIVHVRCTAVTYRLAGEAERRAAQPAREGRG